MQYYCDAILAAAENDDEEETLATRLALTAPCNSPNSCAIITITATRTRQGAAEYARREGREIRYVPVLTRVVRFRQHLRRFSSPRL